MGILTCACLAAEACRFCYSTGLIYSGVSLHGRQAHRSRVTHKRYPASTPHLHSLVFKERFRVSGWDRTSFPPPLGGRSYHTSYRHMQGWLSPAPDSFPPLGGTRLEDSWTSPRPDNGRSRNTQSEDEHTPEHTGRPVPTSQPINELSGTKV